MYFNPEIKLREDPPESLKSKFAELEKYYHEGDWLSFDLAYEAYESSAKAHYISGLISREDLEQIFLRYDI